MASCITDIRHCTERSGDILECETESTQCYSHFMSLNEKHVHYSFSLSQNRPEKLTVGKIKFQWGSYFFNYFILILRIGALQTDCVFFGTPCTCVHPSSQCSAESLKCLNLPHCGTRTRFSCVSWEILQPGAPSVTLSRHSLGQQSKHFLKKYLIFLILKRRISYKLR